MSARDDINETTRLLNEISLKMVRERHRRIMTPTLLERFSDSAVAPFVIGTLCCAVGVAIGLAVADKL